METSEVGEDKRKRVVIGELKEDFLRLVPTVSSAAETSTRDISFQQQHQQQFLQMPFAATPYYSPFLPPRTRGRLNVTLVQATLNKNYGFVRMDPYCRLRIGAVVFETPTDPSGGKTPHWNRTVHGYLPEGIDSIYVEVFDERAFSFDERIAWAYVTLPPAIFSGDTVDDWYSLSGNQGEGKEGMINLVISLNPPQRAAAAVAAAATDVQVADAVPIVLYQLPADVLASSLPRFSDNDVAELKEMFPEVDREVIVGILEEKYGNKEAAVNALLSLSDAAGAN